MVTEQRAIDARQEGWTALNRGAWQEARAAFRRAVDLAPDAEAFEGLAWAAWWQHDGDEVVGARERAYELYRAAGERAGAARVATLLGSDYADFVGDAAVARGWLRRARRLLDGMETIPEHGWLAALEAWYALIEDDDTTLGRSLGATATRLGRQLGSPELEAVGMATEGLALVTEGLVDEGMPLLDEAATAALSGEFEQLWTIPCRAASSSTPASGCTTTRAPPSGAARWRSSARNVGSATRGGSAGPTTRRSWSSRASGRPPNGSSATPVGAWRSTGPRGSSR